MRKVLAMLILGATVALPAAAFADQGDDNHPDSPRTFSVAQMGPQTELPTLGTVAGPGQILPVGPYVQPRLDNIGQ